MNSFTCKWCKREVTKKEKEVELEGDLCGSCWETKYHADSNEDFREAVNEYLNSLL